MTSQEDDDLMDRRDFLKASIGTATMLGVQGRQEHGASAETSSPEPQPGHKDAASHPWMLWYDRPATQWLEALPIGNGRLGAMLYGGNDRETVQLNESTVWAGGPHNYANPDALAALPEIRRLVFAGEWQAAQDKVNAHFMGRPVGQAQYQTVGQLHIDFETDGDVTHYRRQLDLDTAIVTTSYVINGVRYTREAFASVPDQVIVLRLTADRPGKIAGALAFASPQQTRIRFETGNTLIVDGAGSKAHSQPEQVTFHACARLLPENGQIVEKEGGLRVFGADAVTLLISIASSFCSYADIRGDAAHKATQHLEASSRKSYEALKRAHLADYQPRFRRFSLDLGSSAVSNRPTDARVRTFASDHDPALPALYCQYGRYLLLSCSRPGGQPATLQGLWNDNLEPPWGSKYTVNINTEMNYWLAGPSNLLECYEPLFAMLADLAKTGAKTARTHYGAGGWVCHHNTNVWRGTAPVDGAFWGMWPTGGAWLCKSVWDHYAFTGDKKALAKHYPLLKGAAQFFLESLVEEPTHHWRVTCPSVSPENAHHRDVSICAGPTMDTQILRDLFDACIGASKILHKDSDFREQVKAARGRLAPMQIGVQGQLQEWLADWDGGAPEPHHRHVSHLYGLYPSAQITRRSTPELFAAARKSLETRGDESTGWAMAWRINLWARLEDGDHAYKLITGLLTPARTAPNLFDLHPPFQIDGNFGGAAGILEMLVQSHSDELHLLPALPTAWPAGSVTGLCASGGFTVDMEWAAGTLVSAVIHSTAGTTCHVRLGDKSASFTLRPGATVRLNADLQQRH